MIQKRLSISIMAVAALAVFAVAAVILLAGGNPAQATTAATVTPDNGGGDLLLLPQKKKPTPTPTPETTATPPPTRIIATPEPCPAEATDVVDSGHIALFDVYWNPVEGELTNNPCPPTVEYDSETGNITRSPSSINIDETIIHIPNSAKIDLSASDTRYPRDRYEDLWDADDEEDRNGSGIGDRKVWALRGCPPDGPSDSVMCLSFSAALLNSADWDGNIVYHLDHAHQTDIDKQDPRYTLAYEEPAAGAAGKETPLWDSSDAQVATMSVAAGGYERPMWFFTSRGTYELQVHITGNPDHTIKNPIAPENSVSSDVREYIIHVGAEADLGVSVSVTAADTQDRTLDPGDSVNIHIQATNQGPDAAPKTKVQATLPEGLTNVRQVSPLDDYNLSTGVWNVGNLASGANDNLLLTATVAPNTRGQELAVKATISATESVTTANDTYDVPVVDPEPGNNMATGTVAVTSIPNDDPMFMVTRSVPENSPAGTLVGDPIGIMEPNSGDTLTPSLTGEGANQFTVSSVSGGAQISVANGATLDYETKQSYKLTLGVSDGKDDDGNDDGAVDHTIAVLINVTDVDEPFRATLEASSISLTVGETVTLTPTVFNAPALELHHAIDETKQGEVGQRTGGFGVPQAFTRAKSSSEAGTYTYYMVFWPSGGDPMTDGAETNRVTVTWSAPQ